MSASASAINDLYFQTSRVMFENSNITSGVNH